MLITTTVELNEDGVPLLYDGTEYRALGCLPPRYKVSLPNYDAVSYPLLKPDQWQELDLTTVYPGVPVLNQGSSSSCVGYSSTDALKYARMKDGQPFADLHPRYVYSLINGGRDAGAVISDALEVLITAGACRTQDGSPNALYPRDFGPEAKKQAGRYRILEAVKIRTVAEIHSAASLGYPVVVGILVGQNFVQVDREGVAPLPDRVIGGHALLILGRKRLPSGRIGLKTRNSWGSNFALNGYCYLIDSHFDRQLDAFAVISAIDDPGEASTDAVAVR
jgi:hypothetical protein